MTAYYNEFDPKAAAWLRELIAQGHIAYGDVDERSIEDVRPSDLAGYAQCHFFAGIGVWSYALCRAGWDDERPVWTGSCPCQPFSAAGKGAGFADERHLWPAFHHLISVCRPPVVFGEQVASKDGLGWLDLVQADLEGSGYASGAVDLCAAGVGAPHIRQRLWWVAERLDGLARDEAWLRLPGAGREANLVEHASGDGRQQWRAEPSGRSAASGRGLGGLADSDDAGLEGRGQPGRERAAERLAGPSGVAGGLADAHDTERRSDATGGHDSLGPHTGRAQGASDLDGRGGDGWPGPVNGVWRDADWLYCRDGKWRPVESSAQQMVDGPAPSLGHLWMERDGESEDGQSDAGPALSDVRDATGAETLQRTAGGFERVQETGLLRSDLHGRELRGPDQSLERQELSAPVGEDEEGSLRALWEEGAPRPPQRREPDQQRAGQLGEPMRFLSQKGAPPSGCFPLAVDVKHRVGLLRGYGNAIIAPAAQAFIEAYLCSVNDREPLRLMSGLEEDVFG